MHIVGRCDLISQEVKMKNQLLSLNQLLKKYKSEKENLEKQIKEKTEKVKIVYEALRLLEQEGALQNIQTFSSTSTSMVSLNEKYKGIGLNKAILDVVSNSDKYLDANEIFDELIKNGFLSGSSDIKRDVYIGLYRLDKAKKIIFKSVENRKKYMITQKITQ